MGRYDALTSLELNTEPPCPQAAVTKKRGSTGAVHAAASAATDDAGKRLLLRRSFDFYEDQIVYLTRVSLENRLTGRERAA